MTVDQPAVETEATGWEATRADVARQLRACLSEDRQAATAVITDVEGSAYRRPGARLVVTEESAIGAITAGCLEGPVAEVARTAIADGVPVTETYDLTNDDEEAWGMGLGCNGVIDVLMDPVDASLQPALDAMARKERAVVATVLSVDEESRERSQPAVSPGDRTTVLADGSTADEAHLAGTGRSPLPRELIDGVSEALTEDSLKELSSSTTVTISFEGAERAVFCDVYEPIPTLFLFGSQGDVRPVARIAREAGFRVAVVTGRGAKADGERFPAADSVRAVRAPDLGEAVEAPEHTYTVLMSHNFLDDRLALDSLLETAVPYIGLMGPQKRFAEMREAFAEEDRPLTVAELERIATPVGLDLGGDEPTQIALSVVGEVLAEVNDRPGGRLSDREGHVHDR
ncbi:XdhC family protein [Halolamina sp.]|uniref:XdhC family protein n=1 Tax=Halolamina sp. TaxID=1940283 RepID=UPI002FC3A62E